MSEEKDRYLNKFLVAMPGMEDPNFSRTVVLIVGEDESRGVIGLVVNRPAPESVAQDVLSKIGLDADAAAGRVVGLGYGGPCQREHGFLLVSAEKNWEGTVFRSGDVALTLSPEVLAQCARGQGPEKLFFTLGCSGWEPGQLDREIREGSWLLADVDSRVIFDLPFSERYDAALAATEWTRSAAAPNAAFAADVAGHA